MVRAREIKDIFADKDKMRKAREWLRSQPEKIQEYVQFLINCNVAQG